MENITQLLLSKICHDLINPLSTAKMAIESNEQNYIKQSIEDLTLKLEIYRTIFKNSPNQEQYNILNKFITKNNLNIKIDKQHENLAALIYCLANKITKKSYIHIGQNTINMQICFLTEDDINIIKKIETTLTSTNILLFLSIKNSENMYNFIVDELGLNEWKITIQNI